MRKFIFLFIGCILSLISCHKSKENIPLSSEDPFVFNMSNYFDFLKQGRALILEDSDRVGYARVTEFIVDSLTLNDSTKEFLKFGFKHSWTNLNDRVNSFDMAYIKEDSIIFSTFENNLFHRFYPTLEALKQMKYKMVSTPAYPTSLKYRDNDDILYETFFNKEKNNWECYVTIWDYYKDTTDYELYLTPRQFDSLIYKMDKIRNYLERGEPDTFIEDLKSGKRKMN